MNNEFGHQLSSQCRSNFNFLQWGYLVQENLILLLGSTNLSLFHISSKLRQNFATLLPSQINKNPHSLKKKKVQTQRLTYFRVSSLIFKTKFRLTFFQTSIHNKFTCLDCSSVRNQISEVFYESNLATWAFENLSIIL